MTEAIANVPANHELVQVRHYEAGPPLELVEPPETFATTKEEEWVSKKKTELTTTRQIETRVKRQVVLEDGKVVEDSGPIVTTNTSEDTEKQEHSQTELKKLGGDEVDNPAAIKGAPGGDNKVATVGKDWVPAANPDGVVREVKEKRVISREETEDVREVEEKKYLGDFTDEDFIAAVHSGSQDIRPLLSPPNNSVVATGPRVVHESHKSRKVTDTEDTAAVSSVRADGKIVTETTRSTQHEEVKDEPLKEGEVVEDKTVENSQRYKKTKDQEFVEYLADGVKIGGKMRYKAETMEGERQGEGLDETDWDSLSTRMRRQRRQQLARGNYPHKTRGIEDQVGPPLDRKDALTKKPLDFDEEEETRKQETSKWLEHHFGSESTRSSRDSIDDEEPTHSKSFFNVTIKSQPAKIEQPVRPSYVATQRVYSPSPEPERVTPVRNGYFQGISEWSERKQEEHRNYNGYTTLQRQAKYREDTAPTPPERKRAIERRQRSSQDSRYDSGYRTHSRNEMSRDSHDEPQDEPPPDYSPPPRHSPMRHSPVRNSPGRLSPVRNSPVRNSPPQRYSPSNRHSPPSRQSPPEMLCTPPPSPPPSNKKSYQRTRFAPDRPVDEPPPPKQKHGIASSIRKLVGKIRSASAERKAKSRAKRSPSPQTSTTYQQYNVIDNIPRASREREREAMQRRGTSPVQRYYLGEDPFGGSIYGRENKYDGVKPIRKSKHKKEEDDGRSHSTLGRFSKSTSQVDYTRTAQTLPRNIRSETTHRTNNSPSSRLSKNNQSNSTINVSIINTVSPNRPIANGGPAKPARTYKSHLSRSKSFNVHAGVENNNMYKSNPQLHRLEENPIGLKSPGIVSSISRSTRDLSETVDDNRYTSRFAKNGYEADNKKVFLKGLKERAPDLYKTLQSDDEEHLTRKWQTSTPTAYSTPLKSSRIATYNQDNMYEPPTRLNSTEPYAIRRGSNSTDDYSETYHTTTRNDDPKRPSVTDTVKTISKKTVPTKDGRSMQTIESTETKSITRSRFRGEPTRYENGKLNSSNGGVIIEVKNYRR